MNTTTTSPLETKSPSKKPYSIGEEIANSLSHGIGAALGIAGLVILVVFAALQGDPWRVVGFAIYGTTLVILFTASTLYHGIQHTGAKSILQRIDHASIYLLIAGTYTPILLVSMRGAWGWSLFGVIWGIAAVGTGYETFSARRRGKLSVIVYLLMGWLCVIALRQMLVSVSSGGLAWLAAGGLLYTAGVIFYIWHKLPYNHAIWHLFVLGGSVCHFFAMLFHILPAA
ncbi:MAG: hemolysin III family protein [Candidatus Marinimicrobia bacterium]|nr:hemolysin III family protein [Candidatus Neomarinimicrobiota bacterium]